MEKALKATPPQHILGDNDISIVHSVKKLYATIYQTGNKLAKHDKLGIHARIEDIAIQTVGDIIGASLCAKSKKLEFLEKVRVSLEILKHLTRTEHELKIIDEKQYIRTEHLIIETSKMANGWIKYLTQNPAKAGL